MEKGMLTEAYVKAVKDSICILKYGDINHSFNCEKKYKYRFDSNLAYVEKVENAIDFMNE